MWSVETAKWNSHIFSEYWDIAAFTAPVFVSTICAPFLYEYVAADEIPLWGYLFVVVFSDVAHVWTTLFRTHFNSSENARRPFLYNRMPILLLLSQIVVHFFLGERIFWTVVGYLAIYHFIKQQYGILMIAQCREKNFRNVTRDKWLLYALSGAPIALWHCDSSRQFDWFNRDDSFLLPFQWLSFAGEQQCFSIMGFDVTALRMGYAAWIVLWGVFISLMSRDFRVCRAEKKPFPVMRSLLLLYSGITWGAGVLVSHKMIALTFLNLYHAVPSFLIVFCASHNHWRVSKTELKDTAPQQFVDKIGRLFSEFKSRFPLFLILLMLLGLFEECLWEILVWRDYVADELLSSWMPTLQSPFTASLVTSVLILPQTTHYILDMYIWKMRRRPDGSEENPGLKRHLALAP